MAAEEAPQQAAAVALPLLVLLLLLDVAVQPPGQPTWRLGWWACQHLFPQLLSIWM